MDFGMGSYDGLTEEHFLFPASTYYFQAPPVKQKLFIGLPKWGDMEHLIPNVGVKQSLEEYFKIFNSIELNATHYKIYDEATIANWLKPLRNNAFSFCPKIYKGITHYGSLKGKEEMVEAFTKSIDWLGAHLGPIFIQLNNNFTTVRKQELLDFLTKLPLKQYDFFIEVRHSSWFTGTVLTELAQQLHELNIGLVITDTPLVRDVAHMHFPVAKAFIRFVCDGTNPLDFLRLDAWTTQLKMMEKKGVKTIHFFLHVHERKHIPEVYNYVVNKFTDDKYNSSGLEFFPPQPPMPAGIK